jgi:hypothetical protein
MFNEIKGQKAKIQLRMLDAMEVRDASLLSKGRTRLAEKSEVSLFLCRGRIIELN